MFFKIAKMYKFILAWTIFPQWFADNTSMKIVSIVRNLPKARANKCIFIAMWVQWKCCYCCHFDVKQKLHIESNKFMWQLFYFRLKFFLQKKTDIAEEIFFCIWKMKDFVIKITSNENKSNLWLTFFNFKWNLHILPLPHTILKIYFVRYLELISHKSSYLLYSKFTKLHCKLLSYQFGVVSSNKEDLQVASWENNSRLE